MKVKILRNIGKDLRKELNCDCPCCEGDECDLPTAAAKKLIDLSLAELLEVHAVPPKPEVAGVKMQPAKHDKQ